MLLRSGRRGEASWDPRLLEPESPGVCHKVLSSDGTPRKARPCLVLASRVQTSDEVIGQVERLWSRVAGAACAARQGGRSSRQSKR